MLFSNQDLNRIASGRVSVAFRRWKVARVRPGTKLRTRIGVVEVMDVAEVEADAIDPNGIVAAGFQDRSALDRWIEGREGRLFRIGLQPGGPDPESPFEKMPTPRATSRRISQRGWSAWIEPPRSRGW